MTPFLTLLLALAAITAILLGLAPLRRRLISAPVLALLRKGLPQVSPTEQEALDAGTVWWERDLFMGKPDWSKLLAYPRPKLTAEEQFFMDGPVEELCAMVDEWRITHELRDLPPEVWQYIKDKGFFGMIIPKEYGGLGFSAFAHSEVVTKLASRSTNVAVTVMVPNSLGPAELLLHYGTEEQKRHYLPRLARGLEIPCFALTSPEAGSDAASIPDFGIVCRGEYLGRKDVLGIRLTWDKRYITLGPVATLLGLAFQLRDPEGLLGGEDDVGITLALLPTSHPGVNIGRRHLPLDAAFQNGPNWGKDVFIPMEFVIGGGKRCGQGWRMLMNCLAAGRSISLPSNSAGGAKLAARATGAYGRVRVQFKTPIGRFEGVEEAMARIGGNTYIMEAARRMTAGAVDLGEKPSVVSAIVKYHLTERARQVVNDAMDIHGGKGICLGPNNYLGRGHQYMPIGITVEGANILTRSLIIFGQGAIRCHPYLLSYVHAANDSDRERGLAEFDRALFGHARYMLVNALRSVGLALTGARLASAPAGAETAPYYRKLARLSAAYAVVADAALLLLGGEVKRREKLSARLGDVLAQMYLASTALKRFEEEGRQAADLPLLAWSVEDALYRGQQAMAGVLANFPSLVLGRLVGMLVFPLGRPFSPPSDALGHEVAELMITPGAVRDRLTAGIFIPRNPEEPVAALEIALESAVRCEAIEARLRKAVREAKIPGGTPEEIRELGLRAGIISQADADALDRHKALRRKVVMVDDFEPDFGMVARNANAKVDPLPARKTA
ncbi:MAG TPA: acyl-CoA dehydrogenase [Burkholderiales bacterium]